MRIKNEKDFWAGVMFIVVGIAFAWSARAYVLGDSARPGPGYFPTGLGALLTLVGAILAFKSVVLGGNGGDRIGRVAWRPLLTIVASLALFGLALPRLGMFIALPVLVVTSSLASDEFRLRDALVSALVLTVGSWAIFSLGLGLAIPLLPNIAG